MMMADTESNQEEKAAGGMELRDGNYLLSVFVSPPGATLSIEVERKTDGARWRGDFTARYIEEITRRAGSVKSFSNFVKMLRSATNTNSSSNSNKSLHVDVLTYQDLEMLRKDGRYKGPNDKENSDSHSSLSNVAAASDKRYLILTYITEFDRVHYPLPLVHEDDEAIAEEVSVIRKCNQRLHSELNSVKARLRKYESPQHTNFHQRRAVNSIASYSSEDENRSNWMERWSTTPSSEAISMRTPQLQTLESARALQEKVRALEYKLRTEAAAHKKSITTLLRKNALLEDEARKARVAERRISEKLRDSEFQIGLLRGRLKSRNGNSGGGGVMGNNVSPFRTRQPQRTPASPPILSRYVYQGRLRPSSTPPITTRSRYTDQGQSRRSPTSGRYVPHGPSSLPSRSRTSSPMYYSAHSITPPRLRTLAGRSSSCPTSGSLRVHRKAMEIDDWLQQASRPKRCETPPCTTTRTTIPRRGCEGREHELITCRSSNKGRLEVNHTASEVGEIDSRLYALQHYLKRRNG